MNLNTIRPKSEEEDLSLSITKNSETLINLPNKLIKKLKKH